MTDKQWTIIFVHIVVIGIAAVVATNSVAIGIFAAAFCSLLANLALIRR
jgi:hypothetical protein